LIHFQRTYQRQKNKKKTKKARNSKKCVIFDSRSEITKITA